MGGNACKNTHTRRYQREEYDNMCNEVGNLFGEYVMRTSLMRFGIIPAYSEKESFGDMDILYATADDIPRNVDFFDALFSPQEIVRNSNVISLAYKELQIDFIHTPMDEYNYALSYFSYNDCGNLVGKLARRFGLKHGHNGLILPVRDGNNMLGEVTLTRDHDCTLEFLGLDVRKFNSGFSNLDEIFNFIAASPNYNPDDYKLENVSAAGRVRDKKRDTYQQFLKFGENWSGERKPKVDDKSIFLDKIFTNFPDARAEFKEIMYDLAVRKFLKDKFNGDVVSEWTGLRDKELGKFMSTLRNSFYFSPENIIYVSEENLKNEVMKRLVINYGD